jgi:hypothetical protein
MTMASKELSILLLAKDMASKTIGHVSKQVGGLGKAGATASRGIKMLGVSLAAIGAAAAVGLGVAIKTGIAALAKSEAAAAQTAAVIKSTGAAAHVTAAGIDELTASLQAKTAADDDAIRAAANMMLTFTNVRNEVGKGNDIFDQSIAVIADMSRALGSDMSKEALRLGIALNDPIAGMGRLKKVGVTFDAQQKKRITAFIKEGKVTKAQAIILAELNKEFGGSGAAYAATYAGTMESLGFAVEDAQKALAVGFMPVIKKVAEFLKTQLAKPAVIQGIKDLGEGLAGAFEGAMDFAMSIPWESVMGALRGIAGVAKTAVDAFRMMPDWAKQILIGGFVANKLTGGALGSIVGQLAGGLIKGVLGIQAGVVNVTGGVVNAPGGLGGGKGGLPIAPAVGGASLLAGGAAVVAGLAALAGIYAISKANQESKNPVPAQGYYTTPSGMLAYGVPPDAANTYKDRKAGLAGGGRGDSSTAAEVKRLGAIQGVISRAEASGRKVDADHVAATVEKNRQATERVASRVGDMIAAVRAIKIPPPVVNVHTGFTVSIRNIVTANRVASSYAGGGIRRSATSGPLP